ncbi:MAG: GTP-binding protein, partial [Deltaproteobacteria bacterium]|nr:GTP-binding protein [Deltaproteobacteria bacterium]
KINIVDTPGHADFGGEVERIMNMVDGAVLLVDAAEGALPQTRFVLEKALAQNLRVILVVNKVDRPEVRGTSRIQEVVNEIFDLFIELGADEKQADFPILYACGRDGWCTANEDEVDALVDGSQTGDLKPLFDLLLKEVPAPSIEDQNGFQMLISNLSYSDYLGSLAIGRVLSGVAQKGMRMFRHGIDEDEKPVVDSFQVSQVFTYEGLKQVEIKELVAGDIGILAGTEQFKIGDTLVSSDHIPARPRISVDKPTLAMIFSVNTSPFSGQEGEAVQSRKLRDRLLREVRENVALQFEDTDVPDQFRVLARGELQCAILIEQMRREGLEFMVAKPEVLIKKDESGQKLEPIETLIMDIPEEFMGDVSQLFQKRKGIMQSYEPVGADGAKKRIRLVFDVPTKGLLGTRSKFLTMTKGEGLMNSHLKGYEPVRGEFLHRPVGALVADREGKMVEYAMLHLEDQGTFFFDPGTKVYEGMVVGQNKRENDLNVNVCKEKKLDNMRAAHAEILVRLSGIHKQTLEETIEWIDDDEWIEVTPENIRVRKRELRQNFRSVIRGSKK